MKRNLYLNIKEKEAARQEYLDAFAEVRPSAEKIAVSESLGRMTAEAVYAICSSPAYNSCAMDGIAVISSHTKGVEDLLTFVYRRGHRRIILLRWKRGKTMLRRIQEICFRRRMTR